jgi:hypothetical protein
MKTYRGKFPGSPEDFPPTSTNGYIARRANPMVKESEDGGNISPLFDVRSAFDRIWSRSQSVIASTAGERAIG